MTPYRLKEYRHMLGFSTRYAAEICGVAQRTWQAYELGTRHIPDIIDQHIKYAICAKALHIQSLLNDARS